MIPTSCSPRCCGVARPTAAAKQSAQPSVQLFTSAVLLAKLADVLSHPLAARRRALVGSLLQEVLADYAVAPMW